MATTIDTAKVNNLITVLSAGVQTLFTDLSGTDKKAMVTQLVTDGASFAEAIDPKDGTLIAEVANIVSFGIDAVVSVMQKFVGVFKKKSAIVPAQPTV
jgi:hypothetical protein